MGGRALLFLGLGFELFAMAMASIWVGGIIDAEMGWSGHGFLLIMGSCFIAWLVHIIVLVRRFQKEDMDKNNDS